MKKLISVPVFLVVLFALSYLSNPAFAKDFKVNTTEDRFDLIAKCGSENSLCSLRQAIIEANALREKSLIILEGGQTYQLTIQGADEDAAVSGDLDIKAEITIKADC